MTIGVDVRRLEAPPTRVLRAAPGQCVLPLEGELRAGPADLAKPGVPLGAPPGTQPGATTVHAKACRFVLALVEVSAGDRPAGQLSSWMTRPVYQHFTDQLRLLDAARTSRGESTTPRARVVSVHVRMPACDSAEVAARIVQGRRSRALALRLEVRDDARQRERWLCTALSWG